MWMGCPVVSRAGNAHVSRVGVSLLSAVGLDDFICRNREDYIAKAVELAFDQDRIAALRAGMRQRLQTSLLMNAPLYTRNFEAALMSIAALK
jgi:predicted O-linked N-acetylglucosamine transferase (SPINDLY family)